MHILFLEDEPLQRELAAGWMQAQGHEVAAFADGDQAIRAIERGFHEVAVLDLNVPGPSGEEVLRWIRMRTPTMAVIVATSVDEEEEVARILRMGADDYIVKPLRRAEFLARIESVVRRGRPRSDAQETLEVGPYRVDAAQRAIFLRGERIEMPSRVLALAMHIFERRGDLLTRAELYERFWGRRTELESRTLDSHMSKIRSALELDGRHGWKLASVYQHGYRLQPD